MLIPSYTITTHITRCVMYEYINRYTDCYHLSQCKYLPLHVLIGNLKNFNVFDIWKLCTKTTAWHVCLFRHTYTLLCFQDLCAYENFPELVSEAMLLINAQYSQFETLFTFASQAQVRSSNGGCALWSYTWDLYCNPTYWFTVCVALNERFFSAKKWGRNRWEGFYAHICILWLYSFKLILRWKSFSSFSVHIYKYFLRWLHCARVQRLYR